MEYRANIVGVVLLCVAFGSEALTLGRVRGAALVGQPLDMVVPVQMDAGEDVSSLCFDADVFHADTRQEASRVRVVVEATAQPQTVNVRVLSSAVVDEPVVTVYLRAGCGQKTTRRYVLLADFPSEVAAPSSASRVAPVSALPPAQGGLIPATPISANSSSVASKAAPAVKAKTARVSKQAVRQEVVNKHPEVKAAVASPKRTQSRLKLDPLELLSDRVENIDSYMTFAPPEDALRNMQKVQTLEGDVKALLALAAKNEASLVDLKARLQKAESERFPGGLIYGLIAMVLACLAALAFLWTRQRRVHVDGDDWWSGTIATSTSAPPETVPEPSPEPVAAHKELDEGLVSEKAHPAVMPGLSHGSGSSSELGVSLMDMSDSIFDDLMQSGVEDNVKNKLPSAPSTAVAPPLPTPARSLSSEAMLDIRQQAEFFVSLGQTDRAVRILKRQISGGDEPNPFVYLDLLSLFHSLSLKTDFELFRKDFNRLFNGSVPGFAFFKDEGKGLESYPDVLSRITELWSTPKVLEVLEACIFQDPGEAKSESFDLAAFRDLLLLHAVAHSVVLAPHPEGGKPMAGSAPSSAAKASAEMGSPRVLDLDLSDSKTEGTASSPVSAADVDIPLLMPGEHEVDAQDIDARRPLGDGNLLNFALPVAPTQPGPADSKPGPPADLP